MTAKVHNNKYFPKDEKATELPFVPRQIRSAQQPQYTFTFID